MNRFTKTVQGLWKRPVVVAAMQSPHLLNIWKESRKWDLYYDLLGDHEDLEEVKDKEVKSFTSSGYMMRDVSAVLVATPKQLETAKHKFPRAKFFWVVHTGYFLEVFPTELVDDVDGIVTLTKSVMDIQLSHKPRLSEKHNFVITPFYEPQPTWRWKEGVLWTIRSRAAERMPASKDRFDYVMQGVQAKLPKNHEVRFYGSGAPDGYIDKAGKEALFAGSSGYISALPENAGFGLAEHEALARGVPIIGSRWGDIDAEMSERYTALTPDQDKMVEAALRIARDQEYAEALSRHGLEYIKTYRNKKSMDEQLAKFVDLLD